MKNELQTIWFRNYLTDSELYGKGPWLDRGPLETRRWFTTKNNKWMWQISKSERAVFQPKRP